MLFDYSDRFGVTEFRELEGRYEAWEINVNVMSRGEEKHALPTHRSSAYYEDVDPTNAVLNVAHCDLLALRKENAKHVNGRVGERKLRAYRLPSG